VPQPLHEAAVVEAASCHILCVPLPAGGGSGGGGGSASAAVTGQADCARLARQAGWAMNHPLLLRLRRPPPAHPTWGTPRRQSVRSCTERSQTPAAARHPVRSVPVLAGGVLLTSPSPSPTLLARHGWSRPPAALRPSIRPGPTFCESMPSVQAAKPSFLSMRYPPGCSSSPTMRSGWLRSRSSSSTRRPSCEGVGRCHSWAGRAGRAGRGGRAGGSPGAVTCAMAHAMAQRGADAREGAKGGPAPTLACL
jgi:hypothetical protein